MKAWSQLKRLADRTLACLSRHEVFWAEAPLLAAVSGGRDSTLLAMVLAHLKQKGALPVPVILAHVDHLSQPAGATAWDVVQQQANQLQLECTRRQVPEGTPATEEAWRDARYAALTEMAGSAGARLVLTAHHADDNLETVLFRVLRGAGPRGLAGIPELRRLDDRRNVLRPFLQERAADLHPLLLGPNDTPALPVFDDITNRDQRFTRNWLRQEVLPTLRDRLGSSIDASMLALAKTARATSDLLERQANQLLRKNATFGPAWRCQLQAPPDDNANELPFLQEALAQIHQRLDPAHQRPEWNWVLRACELLSKPTGKRLTGPAGNSKAILVERTTDGLLFVAGDHPGRVDEEIPLQVPGETRFGDSGWRFQSMEHDEPPLSPSPAESGRNRALLDPHHAPQPWRLRCRRPGDRFWPLGQKGDVELRRFLQGRAVPRFDRDRLPLLVDANDKIIWVVGVEIAEPTRVRMETAECVEVVAALG